MNLRTIGLIPALLACVLAQPVAAQAQPAAKVHRLGIFSFYSLATMRTMPTDQAFFGGLRA